MTLADMFNKLKQRQEQVDDLLKTLQTAMDNMNKALIHSDETMTDIQKTLTEVKNTVTNWNTILLQVRKDYEELKKKINEKPWWKVW